MTTGRPRIAVCYDPRSTFAMTLHGWLGDTFDLVWIVDSSIGEVEPTERKLLARLGTVVDVTGLDTSDAIRAVRAADPAGVVTFADRRIRLAAELSGALGLPGVSAECAERLVSKYEQRRALADAGIAVPRVWRIPARGGADVATAVERDARMPVVLKPDEGDGSRNIHAIADARALRAAIADAADAGRDVVVEEFLAGAPPVRPELGDYLSVESVVSRGRVQHVAVNGRFPVAWPFRETGFFIPALVPDADLAPVLDLAAAAVRAVGVDVGCTHTEIKLTPDGPRVIEVNGRLGGGVPEMVHLVTGVNLYEVAGRLAAGHDVGFDGLLPCRAVSYLFYVQAPAGASSVVSIDGLDGLSAEAGVEAIRLNHPAGGAVDWHSGNHDYVFSVLGVVPNHEELVNMARVVHEKVVISYV